MGTFRCTNTQPTDISGLSYKLTINQATATPLVISGLSKSNAVTGSADPNYAVVVDLEFADGTSSFGYTLQYDTGTHDWQSKCGTIAPGKPITNAWYEINV